jgi:hypothetical protein
MQTNYAERKDKETCSQDKQTKRADRTSGQVMQTEHAHFAQGLLKLLQHLCGTVTSVSFL